MNTPGIPGGGPWDPWGGPRAHGSKGPLGPRAHWVQGPMGPRAHWVQGPMGPWAHGSKGPLGIPGLPLGIPGPPLGSQGSLGSLGGKIKIFYLKVEIYVQSQNSIFPTQLQCFCTTEHQVAPFDLKIKPIILKFQGLCREVLAILYFLPKMQDSSFQKSKFKFSKSFYKI